PPPPPRPPRPPPPPPPPPGRAQALGARFLDGMGKDLSLGGEALLDLATIDMSNFDPRVEESEFLIACDVQIPLTGKEGATAIFGAQKGATKEMIKKLETSLIHYSEVIKRDLGVLIDGKPWTGAGGGLGGGCHAFLKGELKSGIEVVLNSIGFNSKLDNADLVITGEGCIDNQTAYFKAPMGVAKRSEERGIPVVAIVGTIGEGYEEVFNHGIKALASTPSSYINDAFGSVVMATKEALRWTTLSLDIT
ncbi:MAG: glycerate kinase, partial [Halioglobus sp.]